jgi:predicted dehydrogenase
MAESLRGGVIGAGVFGGHHARQYARLPGVVLSGVLDPHPDRAAALAAPLGGRAFVDMDAFLDAVDVVTIASPGPAHAAQAVAALRAGKPVYVEKPLAVTLEEAAAIRAAADETGLTVACGHQERVLFQVIGLFDIPEPPTRLDAVRHGAPSHRSLDVSVVLDLMIHDLDLALALSPASPVSVQGRGRTGPCANWAEAQAQAAFDDGFAAAFDVSRRADDRRRAMRVVYPSGEVEIDFLTRGFRNTTPFALNADFAETPAAQDTLAASIIAFLQAVRGEAPAPLVGIDDAERALALALEIEASLGTA